MTPRMIFLAKTALRILRSAETVGIGEAPLLSCVATTADTLLTSVEQRALLKILVSKDWIYKVVDPLTDTARWVITENGRLAEEAL